MSIEGMEFDELIAECDEKNQILESELEKCRLESTVLESQLSVLTEKTEIMKIATLILTNEISELSLNTSYDDDEGWNHVTIRFSFKD